MTRSATKISFCVFLLLIISCKKHDYCDELPTIESCDLMQSVLNRPEGDGDEPGTFSQYRKEYGSDGKVEKVVAGLYTLQLYDSVALLLKYSGTTVYFLNESDGADTFLIANFDAQNRLYKLTTGSTHMDDGIFFNTEFFYNEDKLSSYYLPYFGDTTRMVYDAYGNIIRMYQSETSDEEGTFFTYDLSVKASQQWYDDYFLQGSLNALYLAQAMGWLPDLTPPYKRTSYKIVLHEADAEPYQLAGGNESGHVYDSDGKLLSYKAGGRTHTNIWNCDGERNALPN